jgi:predicted phage-related endonuclease
LGVGSSDSPVLLGFQTRSAPLELYANKIGATDEIVPNEAMLLGRELEPFIVKLFCDRTRRTHVVQKDILRSKQWPFMIADLDAIQLVDEEPERFGVVEAKLTSLVERWDEQLPLDVWCQVQHQLAVTGFQFGSGVALVGGTRLAWLDVDRDDAFIKDVLVPQCRTFWEAVQKQEPFEPDPTYAADATKRALDALYPHDNGETVQLDAGFVGIHEEREALLIVKKKTAERLTRIENDIRYALGDATFGRIANGVVYSLKTQKDSVVKEHTRKGGRRLRVSIPKELRA